MRIIRSDGITKFRGKLPYNENGSISCRNTPGLNFSSDSHSWLAGWDAPAQLMDMTSNWFI